MFSDLNRKVQYANTGRPVVQFRVILNIGTVRAGRRFSINAFRYRDGLVTDIFISNFVRTTTGVGYIDCRRVFVCSPPPPRNRPGHKVLCDCTKYPKCILATTTAEVVGRQVRFTSVLAAQVVDSWLYYILRFPCPQYARLPRNKKYNENNNIFKNKSLTSTRLGDTRGDHRSIYRGTYACLPPVRCRSRRVCVHEEMIVVHRHHEQVHDAESARRRHLRIRGVGTKHRYRRKSGH